MSHDKFVLAIELSLVAPFSLFVAVFAQQVAGLLSLAPTLAFAPTVLPLLGDAVFGSTH